MINSQKSRPATDYDVVIIGGGIAGLSATIWLGRYRRSVLVISSGPPRNHLSHAVHGYPGFEGEDPGKLLEKVYKEALGYDVTIVDAWVSDVKKAGRQFQVIASGVEYRSRRILFATGVVDEKPKLPDISKYDGRSIWHCPSCDGFEYADKNIVVVSWGAQMAGYAEELLTYSDKVIVATHGNQPKVTKAELERLRRRGIKVYKEPIVKLAGSDDGQLNSVELADGMMLPCDGLFYSVCHSLRTELPMALGCELRRDGSIKVNRKQETTVKGVYVAGDIAPLEELMIVAAAMGAVAASNIHKSF